MKRIARAKQSKRDDGPVLLTRKEVSDAVGISYEMLRRWVRLGIVQPLVRGVRSGGSHMFTASQAMGVAFAWACNHKRLYGSREPLRVLIEGCSRTPWEVYDSWFGNVPTQATDAWDEESRVRAVSERLDGQPLTDIWPEDVVEDALGRALRLYAVIKQKARRYQGLEELRHGLHVLPRKVAEHKP
jgi:hypothetical protein